jgi:hypothetical protein
MCFGTSQYKLEKGISFAIKVFVLKSTKLCKNFEKICFNITMVEVQTWTPLKKLYNVTTFLAPPLMCFHPRTQM